MPFSTFFIALLFLTYHNEAAFLSVSEFSARKATNHAITSTDGESMVDVRTGKPIGRSFLPEETIERMKIGSPIEKIKLEKDGTTAFNDIYDFAAKIRNGTLNWEDIEDSDLDFVSFFVFFQEQFLF